MIWDRIGMKPGQWPKISLLLQSKNTVSTWKFALWKLLNRLNSPQNSSVFLFVFNDTWSPLKSSGSLCGSSTSYLIPKITSWSSPILHLPWEVSIDLGNLRDWSKQFTLIFHFLCVKCCKFLEEANSYSQIGCLYGFSFQIQWILDGSFHLYISPTL